MTTAR